MFLVLGAVQREGRYAEIADGANFTLSVGVIPVLVVVVIAIAVPIIIPIFNSVAHQIEVVQRAECIVAIIAHSMAQSGQIRGQ